MDMMHPEAALQQACFVYAQQVLPPDADYASIETKLGVSDMRRAAQRKALGIRAGEPDARLIWKGRYYGIEYKAGAAISEAQRIRHEEIEAAGAEVYVIRTVAGLAQLFADMQIPLRHTSLTPYQRDMMWQARVAKQRIKAAATRALTRAVDEEAGVEPQRSRPKAKPRGFKPTLAQVRKIGKMRERTVF